MKKTGLIICLLMCFLILPASSKASYSRAYVLTKISDSSKIAVQFENYEISQAVPSPRGDHCISSNTVSAWLALREASLTVEGKKYLINGEHSLSLGNQNQPGFKAFYYNTFTFIKYDDCQAVAQNGTNQIPWPYSGDISMIKLASQRISFVDRDPNVSTSAVDLILQINYLGERVKLLKLKQNGDLFNPADWQVYAEGPL